VDLFPSICTDRRAEGIVSTVLLVRLFDWCPVNLISPLEVDLERSMRRFQLDISWFVSVKLFVACRHGDTGEIAQYVNVTYGCSSLIEGAVAL
jgi:hypothetical protein